VVREGSGLRRVSSFLSPSWGSDGEGSGPTGSGRRKQWRMSPILEGEGQLGAPLGEQGPRGVARRGELGRRAAERVKGASIGTDTFGRRRADQLGVADRPLAWGATRRRGTLRAGAATSEHHGYTLFPIPDSPMDEAAPQRQESASAKPMAPRSEKEAPLSYQDPQKRMSWKAFKSFLSPARKFPSKSPGR